MKYIRLIFGNLLILLILLITVEAVLEKTNNYRNHDAILARFIRLREFDLPNKKVIVHPSESMRKFSENLDFKDYAAVTDSSGFIQSETLLPNPTHKVVFLGGSTTECQFVDDSLRFPSLVGKKLQQASRLVNTFNSGVSGNQTIHSLNILVNKVIHNNFSAAVLMHNINDLVYLSFNGNYYKENVIVYRRSLVTVTAPEVDDHDLHYFRQFGMGLRVKKSFQVLFPELYDGLHLLLQKTIAPPQPEIEVKWQQFHPVGEAQYQMFGKNLRTFVTICRTNGIVPVLMTQFNRITEEEFSQNPIFKPYSDKLKTSREVTLADFCEDYRKFNDIIRQVAKAENVLLIDLDESVPKTKEQMYDMVHLTNQGSRFVADVVFRALDTRLFPPAAN